MSRCSRATIHIFGLNSITSHTFVTFPFPHSIEQGFWGVSRFPPPTSYPESFPFYRLLHMVITLSNRPDAHLSFLVRIALFSSGAPSDGWPVALYPYLPLLSCDLQGPRLLGRSTAYGEFLRRPDDRLELSGSSAHSSTYLPSHADRSPRLRATVPNIPSSRTRPRCWQSFLDLRKVVGGTQERRFGKTFGRVLGRRSTCGGGYGSMWSHT
ncbi:hypothetical protein K458DRAFT_23657 [Lentithecium fluviatile CBS 122367]|uniref:Uncharacterized protein n=1 Tax=Lentithecium fluviatile CBS 122367 TaxID=1168545 RepID=A0A6G1J4N9_9PLEO|nr:hypothetical protein K458DRAFT_23657 [Lentithecium fluviatile CBS 122367]